MDMPTSKENLKKFKEKVNVEVFEMSAMNGEGIDKIINKLADMLDNIKKNHYMMNKNLKVMFYINLKLKNHLLLQGIIELG